MTLARTKPAVKLDLTPEMGVVLGYVLAEWHRHGLGTAVVTSARDGTHRSTSRHYSGNAVDLRTRHHFDERAQVHHPLLCDFRDLLKHLLGPHGVDVVLHPDDDLPGTKFSPHLHVEHDPKVGRVLFETLT